MIKTILLKLVRFYSLLISPIFGQSCRFYPSCSNYTYEAIEKHGALKGLFLGVNRLLKCHPWSSQKNLCDPVPETFDWPRPLRYNKGHRNKF